MRSHPCPNCGEPLKLSPDATRQTVKCPSCRTTVTLKTRPKAPPPPLPAPVPVATEEELGPARPSPRGPGEGTARPDRKRRRKKKPFAWKALPWPWIGGVGGAVLLLLLISLLGWLFSGSGSSGGAVNVSRDPEDSAHRLVASSLPPQPAAWNVTPDGAEPAAKLRSVFPVPAGAVEALLLSAPASARGAALTIPAADLSKGVTIGKDGMPARPLEWLQYDLRSLDPVARVTLKGAYPTWGPVADPMVDTAHRYPGTPRVMADLSPSGKTLAIVTAAHAIEAWSSAGQRVAELPPEGGAKPDWLGLIDDSRLLVLSGGRLALRELPSGRIVFRSEAGLEKPVVLSPGRKWAVAKSKEGFTWLGTSDGAVGGTLALPAAAAQLGDQPEAAISLDGKKFAAVLPLPPGDSGKRLGLTNDRRLVVAWDVATGGATDGVIVKHEQMHGRFPHTAAWCGPRHLLLGGAYVLDLDLSTPIWFYQIKFNTRMARTSPDGRVWYTAAEPVEGLAKHLEGSKLTEQEKKHGHFLAAWTAPHEEVTKRLEAGRRNFTWCPGTAVRIQVEGEVGSVRQAAADNLAGSMARRGFRVDPAAPLALRLTLDAPKTGEEAGAILKRESAGPYKPGWEKVTFELKNMTYVTSKLEVVDEKGAVWLKGNTVGGGEQGTGRSAAAAAREKVAQRLADPAILMLPAVILMDERREKILIPSRSGIGIDGVQTPAPEDVR